MDPDHLLAEKLRRGEAGALAEVFRLHGARVYRLCLRILGRPTDAEDAAQEVFLKLTERTSSFDGRARLTTWIHRLTVNHCLNHLEKERLRTAEVLSDGNGLLTDSGDSPIEQVARAEATEHLERLLQRLSDEHRVALVLREIEGLSYQEIAETLGIPLGTVMSRLSRAREQLLRLVPAPEADRPRPAPSPR